MDYFPLFLGPINENWAIFCKFWSNIDFFRSNLGPFWSSISGFSRDVHYGRLRHFGSKPVHYGRLVHSGRVHYGIRNCSYFLIWQLRSGVGPGPKSQNRNRQAPGSFKTGREKPESTGVKTGILFFCQNFLKDKFILSIDTEKKQLDLKNWVKYKRVEMMQN